MVDPKGGSHRFRLLERIGSGAYGAVFKATDEAGSTYAVKRIPISERGLDCLLEASIMSTIRHPYINRAHMVHADAHDLYIVQELASSDLYTRCHKGGQPLTLEQLRRWAFQTVAALKCLHEQRIIHCDIKAANILLFGESVRLCDFTLSQKQWPGTVNKGLSGTSTHRAPEIWLGRTWGYAADIWALGCTLYEIAYGRLLFPVQKKQEPKWSQCQRSLDCIFDWMRTDVKIPVEWQSRSRFEPWRPFPPDDRYPGLNRLIKSMLSYDPHLRPTLQEILRDDLFRGLNTGAYLVVSRESLQRGSEERSTERCMELLKSYRIDEDSFRVALQLYRGCRYSGIERVEGGRPPFELLVAGCVLIATKLTGVRMVSFHNLDGIKRGLLEVERLICWRLGYRLH